MSVMSIGIKYMFIGNTLRKAYAGISPIRADLSHL